jgi:XPA protein C-terminus
MVLTEEQKERIQRNRERALELQRLKRKSEEESIKDREQNGSEGELGFKAVKRHCTDVERSEKKELHKKSDCLSKEDAEFASKVSDDALEAFEEGASEYVTKQEAMKMYCLPQGTLDVCSFIERPNPKKASWSNMKLYSRAEIRQRAHKRYGGVNGLRAEREKRSLSRFEKDLEKSKHVFHQHG